MGCGGSEEESSANSRGGGGWGGWGAGGGGNRVTSVETQNVSLQPIADQVRSFGTIKAQDVISITPQVSNRITRFYVDLGDTVRQGQLLAKSTMLLFVINYYKQRRKLPKVKLQFRETAPHTSACAHYKTVI